ncbi:MFS transporter [Marivirga sp. S37H4]|uniref:MFS transporter n=1 Tax=Marivirga aurantiaca TaxID=2802615 RepID=A0A934X143_9BACT|nr:MFS transporter [Marivirga aurantiaca]MBK6266749.1 MFS transporter [Marivirga aurantiaca]
MGSWKKLFSQYYYILIIGFIFAYFSSFGQTFLISLYIPSIEKVFGMSNAAMGSLYAAATVASALTLPYLGSLFDRMSLGKYMAMILIGLFVALISLSFAFHVIVVGISFYLLRLFGQGLMSHTAVSTMTRYFDKNRGKAIGIATTGHPFGEATLPVLITLCIGWLGWRGSLQLNAALVLLFIMPVVYWLYRKKKKQQVLSDKDIGIEPSKTTVWDIISNKAFVIIAPAVFALGFTNTAIFFFQLKLGAAKGWSDAWVSSSLAAFAGTSALGMFVAGPLVDRLSAKMLFPFILIPYLAGVLVLLTSDAPIIYPLALALMGFANGSGSTIKNALFAEIFGVEIIGKVRSLFVTVMVLSTALGPLLFGILVDANYTFNEVFLRNAVGIGLVILLSFRIKKVK